MKEKGMELKELFTGFAYNGVSCLFYSVDKDGGIWVLLGKRRNAHLFSSPYHWSIPEGTIKDGESALDAAMRIAYEETGILDDRNKAELFWSAVEGGISEAIYCLKLSTKVPPKQTKSYTDLSWFRLGDRIDDIDPLASDQLRKFESYLKTMKKAV